MAKLSTGVLLVYLASLPNLLKIGDICQQRHYYSPGEPCFADSRTILNFLTYSLRASRRSLLPTNVTGAKLLFSSQLSRIIVSDEKFMSGCDFLPLFPYSSSCLAHCPNL